VGSSLSVRSDGLVEHLKKKEYIKGKEKRSTSKEVTIEKHIQRTPSAGKCMRI
jgi:hypothetical protein